MITLSKYDMAVLMSHNIVNIYINKPKGKILEKEMEILLRFLVDNFHPTNSNWNDPECIPIKCVRYILHTRKVRFNALMTESWEDFSMKYEKILMEGYEG